jgi:hypothetical protein
VGNDKYLLDGGNDLQDSVSAADKMCFTLHCFIVCIYVMFSYKFSELVGCNSIYHDTKSSTCVPLNVAVES